MEMIGVIDGFKRTNLPHRNVTYR